MRIEHGELACLEFCRQSARTVIEIEERLSEIGIEFAPKRIYGFLKTLELQGLLQAEIYGASPVDERPFLSPPYRRRYYRTSGEGVVKLQVSYDFFVAVFQTGRPIGVTTTPSDSEELGVVRIRKRDELETTRSLRRLARPEELKRLIQYANLDFAIFYQFWRQADLTFDFASNLQISDFDVKRKRISDDRLSSENAQPAFQMLDLAMQRNSELWRIALMAIEGRSDGPAFRLATGGRWTIDTARVYFNRARAKAGLPKEVVMQGHRRLG